MINKEHLTRKNFLPFHFITKKEPEREREREKRELNLD